MRRGWSGGEGEWVGGLVGWLLAVLVMVVACVACVSASARLGGVTGAASNCVFAAACLGGVIAAASGRAGLRRSRRSRRIKRNSGGRDGGVGFCFGGAASQPLEPLELLGL